MDNSLSIRADAMIAELVAQRNAAMDKCVNQAARIALLAVENDVLKKQLQPKPEEKPA